MDYEKLIDKRPYKKTIIITDNTAAITRKNVTTGKQFTVQMDKDAWLNFYKHKDIKWLSYAGLTDVEILFVNENILEGEEIKV